VSSVEQSASRAGVKVGDWVLAVSGQPLDPGCSPQVLAKLLETSAKPLALGLERSSSSSSATTNARARPQSPSLHPTATPSSSSSSAVLTSPSSPTKVSSTLSSLDLSVNLVQGSLLLLHGGALFSFARLDQVGASLRLGAASNETRNLQSSDAIRASRSGSTGGESHANGGSSGGGDLSATATVQALHLLDLTPQGAKHRDVIRPPSHHHPVRSGTSNNDGDSNGAATDDGHTGDGLDDGEEASKETNQDGGYENSNSNSSPSDVVNAPPMVALDFKRSASGTSSLKAKVSDLTACICGRFKNEMAAYLKHRPIQARLKQLERDGKEAAAAAKALHRNARRNTSNGHTTTSSRVERKTRMAAGTASSSSSSGTSSSSSSSSSGSSSSEESIQADEEPVTRGASSHNHHRNATQEKTTEVHSFSSTPPPSSSSSSPAAAVLSKLPQEASPPSPRPAPLQFFLEVFRLEAVLPRNSSSAEATALLVEEAVVQSVPNLRGVDTWDLASLTSENVASMLGVAAKAATRKAKATTTTAAKATTTSEGPHQQHERQQQQQQQQQPSAHLRSSESSNPLVAPALNRTSASDHSSRGHRGARRRSSRSPKRGSKSPPPMRRTAAASAAEESNAGEDDEFEDARAMHSDGSSSSGDDDNADAYHDASAVAHPESSSSTKPGKLSSPRAASARGRSDHTRRSRRPPSPRRHSPFSSTSGKTGGFEADPGVGTQEELKEPENDSNDNDIDEEEEILLQQQAKEDEDLLAGAGVNVDMVESPMGRISVMLHRVRLFSATKAALNDDLDRTELQHSGDDEDDDDTQAANVHESSPRNKNSNTRTSWFAVSAFDEVPIAMVAPRKSVYALPQTSEDLVDVHQPSDPTSSSSSSSSTGDRSASAAAVDAAVQQFQSSTIPTSRKAALKLKAKAEVARKRKVRQEEAQGRDERCERVTSLEWHAVLHGDLGVIVDQGLSRPRILLCSPQPYARSSSGSDSTSNSNMKGSRAMDLGIESGRDEDVLGCPHIDLSMAQFYLAMSAWWDNLAELPEFIDYAPAEANGKNDASSSAAATAGEDDDDDEEDKIDKLEQEVEQDDIGQDLETRVDSNEPALPSSRQEWGFWPQVFASPAWLEKWRALRWGWEFCVFLPAVRIDASMETAYFPDPPPSLACVLNAAGIDVKLPSALKAAYMEHNARARAVREEAAAAAQRDSSSSSSRRGHHNNNTSGMNDHDNNSRNAAAAGGAAAANAGNSPTFPSSPEGIAERRLPSVVPFLQLEATGLRVHFVGGGRKPQLPVVEAAEPFFNVKPRCMLITISMTDLDLIDCRRPLGAPPPVTPFARGIGTRSARSFPTPLERYVIRARNEHTKAAAKLFDPKKARPSNHVHSTHRQNRRHRPDHSTASTSPSSSQPSTPSAAGTTATGAQLAGGGGEGGGPKGGEGSTDGHQPFCCPACVDPDRLLACLWPCSEHGTSPCARRPWDATTGGDPRAADPLAPSSATLLRRMSRFVEPVGVTRSVHPEVFLLAINSPYLRCLHFSMIVNV